MSSVVCPAGQLHIDTFFVSDECYPRWQRTVFHAILLAFSSVCALALLGLGVRTRALWCRSGRANDAMHASRLLLYFASLVSVVGCGVAYPALQLQYSFLDRRQAQGWALGPGNSGSCSACIELMWLWLRAMPRGSFAASWQYVFIDRFAALRPILHGA